MVIEDFFGSVHNFGHHQNEQLLLLISAESEILLNNLDDVN